MLSSVIVSALTGRAGCASPVDIAGSVVVHSGKDGDGFLLCCGEMLSNNGETCTVVVHHADGHTPFIERGFAVSLKKSVGRIIW